MSAPVVFWIFGFALAGIVAAMVGKPLVAERGARRVLPVLVPLAVAIGALLGWAINAYLDYVRASATMHF